MLHELPSKIQHAWLARAVSAIQPNDQMHMPEPQALLAKWTAAAYNDIDTPAEHAYHLARYWSHGLRFPAHAPTSRQHIVNMLACPHLKQSVIDASDALLAAEMQPVRLMRLWALVHDVLPEKSLVPQLNRLLSEPLPTGKKLKITQINPTIWARWLPMQEKLTPAAFKAGLELHVRANLTSRQETDPVARAAVAWEMLQGYTPVLDLLDAPLCVEPTEMQLPRPLPTLLEYADAQTLEHFPWDLVQAHFQHEPEVLYPVWLHLFNRHKNVLLKILPRIEAQYHERILYWFLELEDFYLEDDRCAPMLRLVKEYSAWAHLFNKMLRGRNCYKKLGTYLLASCNPQSPPEASQMPGQYLAQFGQDQWRGMFMPEGRPSFNSLQLFQIWELVRVHKLDKLATCGWLQRATMEAIPLQVTRLNKVSVWDITLGLPAFYATMLRVFLPEAEQESWFLDWTEKPSVEKMIVQTFKWFNPDIEVPTLRELHLLAQAFSGEATIVDVLSQLGRKIETLELPSVLES